MYTGRQHPLGRRRWHESVCSDQVGEKLVEQRWNRLPAVNVFVPDEHDGPLPPSEQIWSHSYHNSRNLELLRTDIYQSDMSYNRGPIFSGTLWESKARASHSAVEHLPTQEIDIGPSLK